MFQTPPKSIEGSDDPLRYHAMDPLSIGDRNAVDARAVEDFLIKGVQPGTTVFLKYDRESNTFTYILGDHWDSGHRFVGSIPEPSKNH